MRISLCTLTRHAKFISLAGLALLTVLLQTAAAHPLGNFTVNHFTRIQITPDRIILRYVVDMAEIPAFQELQAMDSDGDGAASNAELQAFLERKASNYADGLAVTIDGNRIPLSLIGQNISTPMGAGGLSTLRIECDLEGKPVLINSNEVSRLRFENLNDRDRIGWHEIAITPAGGLSLFDSSAFGNGVTDELKAYPEDQLAAPLNERDANLSFTAGGIPAGAAPLMTRDGRPSSGSRDRFAELIAVPEVTPSVALFGLLIAAMLGGLHALSPGHGKTVVGAYLVGSRGTARHAAFLGLTVTVTHTAGVFALGLITLLASQYILPDRLFPILSLISGGIVLVVGLTLFIRRLKSATGNPSQDGHHHSHQHEHTDSSHEHLHHGHAQSDSLTHSPLTHSHGGREHTHLPPGANGGRVSWRSLLALGISGGLLPCPSALVVLLSAISLHRVGYGLLLVVAFSLGLAATLTIVGLVFVYAARLLKRSAVSARLTRVLPVISALFITCVGLAICYEALVSAGIDLAALFSKQFGSPPEAGSISTISILTLGLVFGLKHAVEADHLAAVSAIVSERKSILSSSIVGGLWGLGHTISLLIAGIIVLFFNIQIGEKTSLALELCVAIMLILLGGNALRKLMRGGSIHVHQHRHGERAHLHLHAHDQTAETDAHTHHGLNLNARPIFVGMMHGLAGSAALMLVILSTISSPMLGLIYIAVFGVGSIGGMLLMSALVSLPLRLTARFSARANWTMRMLAGVFSVTFGLFMIYEIGFVSGLLG